MNAFFLLEWQCKIRTEKHRELKTLAATANILKWACYINQYIYGNFNLYCMDLLKVADIGFKISEANWENWGDY